VDILHKLLKMIDHNRYAVMGLLLAAVLSIGIVGCQVRTASLIDPTRKVDAAELNREIITVKASLAARSGALNTEVTALAEASQVAKDDLAAQQERRVFIIESIAGLGQVAAEGAISPASAIGSITQIALALAGVGLLADNRRKDKPGIAKAIAKKAENVET